MLRKHVAIITIALGLGTFGTDLGAEPLTLSPDDTPATLIEFKAEPGIGDHVGRAEGEVGPAGARFFLKGLNVMSPLVIQVFASDPANPVDVALHRFVWTTPDLKGETDGEGNWGFVGRVHDEVGIQLRADEPSDFYVLAWQGPAVEPQFGMRQVFTTDIRQAPEAEPAASEQGGGAIVWAVVGLAAAIVLLAVVLLVTRRGKGSATAAAVAVLLLAGHTETSQAMDLDARVNDAERRIAKVEDLMNEMQAKNAEEMENVQRQLKAEQDERAAGDEFLDTQIDAVMDYVAALEEEFAALRRQQRATQNELRNLAANSADAQAALMGHINTLYMLVEEDRLAEPDPTHGGVAPMPSQCFDDPNCAACFSRANAKLSERLALYEQLRIIYQTNKAFTDKMVEMGDTVSGYHQLEQAAWYAVKQQIKASQRNVEAAYKNKYTEFNGKLLDVLREFGQCEADYGLEDWYNRYGVFFYNSLIASYRL